MIKKPETIYTTEETTTTKKFNYGKPEGWDKRPPLIKPKPFKMKWWQIIREVWSGREDIEPKYLVKYDNWMHELKIMLMTVSITFCLGYMVFHSRLVTTSAANDAENQKNSWLDDVIDYSINKYDEWKGVPTPTITQTPDTIYQVRKDTLPGMLPIISQREVDSIINSYNRQLDSTRAVDSLNGLTE